MVDKQRTAFKKKRSVKGTSYAAMAKKRFVVVVAVRDMVGLEDRSTGTAETVRGGGGNDALDKLLFR